MRVRQEQDAKHEASLRPTVERALSVYGGTQWAKPRVTDSRKWRIRHVESTPECEIDVDQSGNDLSVEPRFGHSSRHQNADVDIRVPSRFDVALDSMGGDLSTDGVKGTFSGETMGGEIRTEDAPGGADVITMGGNIDVTLTLTSMSGNVALHVPPGFGMKLDLEIAFTKNGRKDHAITAPGAAFQSVSPDWEYGQGSPRKYIRKSGSVNKIQGWGRAERGPILPRVQSGP